jgi:hypothetical protein
MPTPKLTKEACLDFIYEIYTCESMSQIAFLIDTMPEALKEEVKKRKKKATRAQLIEDAHETQAWIRNRRR